LGISVLKYSEFILFYYEGAIKTSQGKGLYPERDYHTWYGGYLDRIKNFPHTDPVMTVPRHSMLKNNKFFSHFRVNLPGLGTVFAFSLSLVQMYSIL
jgi:hypothetical protein